MTNEIVQMTQIEKDLICTKTIKILQNWKKEMQRYQVKGFLPNLPFTFLVVSEHTVPGNYLCYKSVPYTLRPLEHVTFMVQLHHK